MAENELGLNAGSLILATLLKSDTSVEMTVKALNVFAGPISTRHCAWATQRLSKKCRKVDEPLETLCLTGKVRDLNFTPPAAKTNALPLDQLFGASRKSIHLLMFSTLNS